MQSLSDDEDYLNNILGHLGTLFPDIDTEGEPNQAWRSFYMRNMTSITTAAGYSSEHSSRESRSDRSRSSSIGAASSGSNVGSSISSHSSAQAQPLPPGIFDLQAIEQVSSTLRPIGVHSDTASLTVLRSVGTTAEETHEPSVLTSRHTTDPQFGERVRSHAAAAGQISGRQSTSHPNFGQPDDQSTRRRSSARLLDRQRSSQETSHATAADPFATAPQATEDPSRSTVRQSSARRRDREEDNESDRRESKPARHHQNTMDRARIELDLIKLKS